MSGSKDQPDWPSPAWELTAPESHVIEHRGGANSDVPFRLAVKELAARGVLAAHPTKGGLLRAPSFVMTDGPRIHDVVVPVLMPVLDAYRETPPRSVKTSAGEAVSGVPMSDLLETASDRFGGSERYLDHCVAPALVERGLLQQTGRRGRGSRLDFDWTEAGRDAEQALERWLSLCRNLLEGPQADDPAVVEELLSQAGSAVLLLDGFDRKLAALGAPASGIAYFDVGAYAGGWDGAGIDSGGSGGGDG